MLVLVVFIISSISVFVCLFVFLCSLGWPGSWSVDQAGLELKSPLGLQTCATTIWLFLFFFLLCGAGGLFHLDTFVLMQNVYFLFGVFILVRQILTWIWDSPAPVYWVLELQACRFKSILRLFPGNFFVLCILCHSLCVSPKVALIS